MLCTHLDERAVCQATFPRKFGGGLTLRNPTATTADVEFFATHVTHVHFARNCRLQLSTRTTIPGTQLEPRPLARDYVKVGSKLSVIHRPSHLQSSFATGRWAQGISPDSVFAFRGCASQSLTEKCGAPNPRRAERGTTPSTRVICLQDSHLHAGGTSSPSLPRGHHHARHRLD